MVNKMENVKHKVERCYEALATAFGGKSGVTYRTFSAALTATAANNWFLHAVTREELSKSAQEIAVEAARKYLEHIEETLTREEYAAETAQIVTYVSDALVAACK